ncbi:MAG: DNA polymerase IV [Bacilli bacterium]|nr:DNA polymerase IV [Bacilli bacterium]MDY6430656.1 DNA polymerase IV [Bacilli bacterium]
MTRIIMHIDLDAFFARCEEIKNPSYEKVPLAIGTRGRSGIISTSNYEARKYGVRSGQPTFLADRNCPSLVLVPPDFSFYKKMSDKFFKFISSFTKEIEKVSIDECFCDVTSLLYNHKSPMEFLSSLQKKLFELTSLKCSIGVAPTKWLAKMSSEIKKPMGITICRRKDIPNIIYPLPIESFWGIGKKTSPKLRNYGINTIGELATAIEQNDPLVSNLLGKFYFTVREWIKGYGEDQINKEPFDPKSIGNQETLMENSTTFDQIEETLYRLAEEVSSRAKSSKKVGKTLSVVVKDTSFHLHSKNVSLLSPTNDFSTIFSKASSIYRQYFEGQEIRLIGITLERLENINKEEAQMSIWNYEEYEKKDKTNILINSLNKKLKKNSLKRASEIKK